MSAEADVPPPLPPAQPEGGLEPAPQPHVAPTVPARVLVVSGSTRLGSRTRLLCDIALEAIGRGGGQARLLDLAVVRLPIFEEEQDEQAARPEVLRVREEAAWADGFILASPEYHGGITGALKNYLDFLYEELAGKLAGIITVSGGSFGGDMSSTAARNALTWCHAFTLPVYAGARQKDFSGDELVNERVRQRVERVAFDVVRYAPILRREFEAARRLGAAVEAGFAGFHVDRDR